MKELVAELARTDQECAALWSTLRQSVAAGEAEAKHLAYLSDRVAMHRGRPQRYGTQFVSRDGDLVPRDGDLVPHELEDPARVDAWRAEVGLGSLAEYEAVLKSR